MIDLSELKEIQIFTIGSNGIGLKDFVQMLMQNKVQTLIDIRSSRMHARCFAYNERDLHIVEDFEIAYEICEELAPSKALREIFKQEKQNKNYNAWIHFLHAYQFQLHSENIFSTESHLLKILRESNRIALLCTEEHHLDCHRTPAASHICDNIPDCNITHLMKSDAKRDSFKAKCDKHIQLRNQGRLL